MQNQNNNQNSNSVFNVMLNSKNVVFNHSWKKHSGDWGVSRDTVMKLMLTIEPSGFVLSRDLALSLSHLPESEVVNLGQKLIAGVNEKVGNHVNFRPMYVNFPSQVIAASDYELLANALIHYASGWFGLRWLPSYELLSRTELITELKPKVLESADEKSVMVYFQNLISANTSLSPTMKDDIEVIMPYLLGTGELDLLVKESQIPSKENLAYVGAAYMSAGLDFDGVIRPKFALSTDILRLIAGLSDGDVSLAEHTKVKKFSRSMRKQILSLLESLYVKADDKAQFTENLLTYRENWVRVAHGLHTGEYANRYPNIVRELQRLRDNEKIQTFNGSLEKAIEDVDTAKTVELLMSRPGVFARSLARLLSIEKFSMSEKSTRDLYREQKRQKARNDAKHKRVVALHKAENALRATMILRNNHYNYRNNQMQNQLLGVRNGLQGAKQQEIEMQKVVDAEHKRINDEISAKILKLQQESIAAEKAIDLEFDALAAKEKEARKNISNRFKGNKSAMKFDSDIVLNQFSLVADKVSTPVLLQVHAHFKNIGKVMNNDLRFFMPKGGLAKNAIIKGKSAKYNLMDAHKVVAIIEEALANRFKEFGDLGNVYIDPELKTQNVPFALRSASKALKTVARGSKFSLDKSSNGLRIFLWWKEQAGERTDIDLSLTMMKEDFSNNGHCGYWDLRGSGVTHSGDITSAPDGACEFIDIDFNEVNKDVRYIAVTISSYSGQAYCNLPECFLGWQERGDLNNGEIFEAKTVQNKIDVTSSDVGVLNCILDLKEREIIWADLSLAKEGSGRNSFGAANLLSNMTNGLVNTPKPNLYDLFELHAKSRGNLVEKPEDADSIFSIHEGVTPYMFDVIASQYMTDEPPLPVIAK